MINKIGIGISAMSALYSFGKVGLVADVCKDVFQYAEKGESYYVSGALAGAELSLKGYATTGNILQDCTALQFEGTVGVAVSMVALACFVSYGRCCCVSEEIKAEKVA